MTGVLPNAPAAHGRNRRDLATKTAPDTGIRGIVLGGGAILAAGIGCFAAWACLAPLNSASIAPGVLVVETKRKVVQHLEGGIVKEILVREGETVEAGQILIRFDTTATQSRLMQADAQLISANARYDRLNAELQELPALRFSPELMARRGEPAVAAAMVLQETLFARRRDALVGETEVLKAQMEQVADQLTGLEARLSAERRRLGLLHEQLIAMHILQEKGHAPRMRVAQMEAEEATTEGNIGDLTAQISAIKQKINETKLQIVNARNGFFREIAEELQSTKQEHEEVLETYLSAADVVRRTEVRAPAAGKVVGLNVFTSGAVVAGGETLMEIVPTADELVVEAMIQTQDIDNVRVGLPAEVRLTAFNYRSTPPFPGHLIHISADRVVDQRSGVAAYHAKVVLDRDAVVGTPLYPGMPAEVTIVLGERTLFDFLAAPLMAAVNRSMREP